MMPYTEEELTKIGNNLARVLKLRKDKQHKDRYQTQIGNKTGLGLVRYLGRIFEDLECGYVPTELRGNGENNSDNLKESL